MYGERVVLETIRLNPRRRKSRLSSSRVFCALLLAFLAASAMQSAQLDRLISETRSLRAEHNELRMEHDAIVSRFEL